MATKKVNALKSFNVTGRIQVDVQVEIDAANLSEALDKAKALKQEDFITIEGYELDGTGPKIVGVSETEYPY